MAFPFCVRENGVVGPSSDRDWAQGKAEVTKVGLGYSFTTRTFHTLGPFIWTLDKIIEQWVQFLLEIPFWVGPFL